MTMKRFMNATRPATGAQTRKRAGAIIAATAATILACGGMAHAGSGLVYRAAQSGFVSGIAFGGDIIASGGTFDAMEFKDFPSGARASLDTAVAPACAAYDVTVVAFAAEVKTAAPNSALFLFDPYSPYVYAEMVVEGQAAPAPLSGSWKTFKGTNPVVTVDPSTCVGHLVFRGLTTTGQSAIVDRQFSLSTFIPTTDTVIAATTGLPSAAPAPFPLGSAFVDFPASMRLSAALEAATLVVAFRGKVAGSGVGSSNDTGVFVWDSDSGIATAAREGDTSCMPGSWTIALKYDDFPAGIQVCASNSMLVGPAATFRVKAREVATSIDTAIETIATSVGCGYDGSVETWGYEGGATPSGGFYANFPDSTPLAASADASNVAFVAKTSSGGQELDYNGEWGSSIATVGNPDSSLGYGKVKLPSDTGPAINNSAELVFRAQVNTVSTAGLFDHPYAAGGLPPYSDLVTFGARNAQIDNAGNITGRVP